MARKADFLDLNTCQPNLKGSFFEKLLPLRKGLFEKYPSAAKGLTLTSPAIKFGSDGFSKLGGGTFSFTTNEKSDKVDYTGTDGFGLTARYKKDAKNFDVTVRGKCNEGNKYLVKYEERQEGAPRYVIGWDCFHKPTGIKEFMKFDPMTTRLKTTFSFPGGVYGIPKEFRLAMDTKFFLNEAIKGKGILFNVGIAYDGPIGQSGLAYNQNSEITLTHIKKINKFQVGVEIGHSVPQLLKRKFDQMPPVVIAGSYEVDKTLTVRAKMNHNLDISLGAKKDFNEHLNVSVGTFLQAKNLHNILMQPPAFGFKVTLKQ